MTRLILSGNAVLAAMFSVLFVAPFNARSQGLNNLWMGGYEDESPPPWGGVDLDFLSGALVITTATRTMDYKRTNTNITDGEGDLLISTNGAYLANATGDTLLNGTGLNPSNYTSNYPEGLHVQQAVLILPKPGSSNIYYLFHSTIDDQVDYFAQRLYITTIDMSLDGGLGGVVTKNQIAIDSLLTVGKITAVRHANGRDWWVLCHAFDTPVYYTLLVTPDGVAQSQSQSIGIVRSAGGGQVCFSPDGSRFAFSSPRPAEGLEVFDFDRCTGLLSDPHFAPLPVDFGAGGVAFSANGRYLYNTLAEKVYQYDVEAPDLAASQTLIATWDGFYSPSPPFATMFDIAQLAPDGKIYISTGNGTLHLHVINAPDSGGLACDMVQHGLELPRYFVNSLPNHPNYHLGPLAGSPCDTLGLGMQEVQAQLHASAYPNPNNGAFTLSYGAQPMAGVLEVRDLTGRLVLTERLPAWSQVHRVALVGEAPGMYQCKIIWGAQQATTRIMLE